MIEEQLNRARKHLEANKKRSTNYYWRLYHSKTATGQPSNKNIKASNFSSESIEESMQLLKDEIENHGQYCFRYFQLKAMSGEKDPNGVVITLENVYYSPENVSGYRQAIGGVNKDDEKVQLFEHWSEKYHELDKKLQEYKHEVIIKEQNARIAALEDSRKTIADTFLDFLGTESGKNISNSLIGLVTQLAIPKITPIPRNKIEPEATAQTDEEQKNDIANSLKKLESVAKGETAEIINSIAEFIKQNPEQAKMFMQQNKKQ